MTADTTPAGTIEPSAPADVPALGRHPSPFVFFGLVFGWSWLWWLTAGLTGTAVTEPPVTWMFLVGGLGPVLAAVVLVCRHYSTGARREFWRRLYDPLRVGWRWWLITAAAAAGPTVVGWLLTSEGDFSVGVSSARAASMGVVVWLVFAGGAALVEEPGWRGYALDTLLKRHSLTVTSVLLGVAWAAWHLPHFFLEGTYQHDEVGLGGSLFWMFLLAILAQTFLYVWIVTNTSGSILTAVVFHALTNLAGEIFNPGPTGKLVALLIWMAAAVAVAIHWRRSGRPTPGVNSALGREVIP